MERNLLTRRQQFLRPFKPKRPEQNHRKRNGTRRQRHIAQQQLGPYRNTSAKPGADRFVRRRRILLSKTLRHVRFRQGIAQRIVQGMICIVGGAVIAFLSTMTTRSARSSGAGGPAFRFDVFVGGIRGGILLLLHSFGFFASSGFLLFTNRSTLFALVSAEVGGGVAVAVVVVASHVVVIGMVGVMMMIE